MFKCVVFFFFKQKTAYEMRISDWSSDVCSSDLPETFTSGFSNDAIDQAETMDGPTLAWMREQAAALDAAVTGSVQLRVETAGGPCVFNRMLWVTPDGEVRHYDKRHLFRYAREHERYAAGSERLVGEWKGWRINPLEIGRAH